MKNEHSNAAQPVLTVLSDMTERQLEDRWLTLAVLEDRMSTKESRAWAQDLMNQVHAELAKRQK